MNAHLPGFSYDSRTKTARFYPYVPGGKGRERRMRTVFAATVDDAVEQWLGFRKELAAAPGAPTLRSFVEEFGARIDSRKRPRTRKTHDAIIRNRLLPTFGETALDEFTSSAVTDFASAMRQEGLSAAYVHGCVRVLKALLREAVEREVIEVYPLTKKVKLDRPNLPRLELTVNEQRHFLAAFDDFEGFRAHLHATQKKGKIVASLHFGEPRVFGGGLNAESLAARYYFERFSSSKPIFMLALETGLRKGDLLALEKTMIDREGGFIDVSTMKTGGEALIPISAACDAALAELTGRNPASRRICLTLDGEVISETTLIRYFRLAKKLAGITRRCRFHDLRHTFGSNLASEGVSLQLIQKALGHSSIEMTERYARPSLHSLAEVKRALDRRHLTSTNMQADPAD